MSVCVCVCVCVSPLLRVHLSRGCSVASVARLQLSAALMDHMAGSVGFIRLKGAEIINSTQMCLQLRTVQLYLLINELRHILVALH